MTSTPLNIFRKSRSCIGTIIDRIGPLHLTACPSSHISCSFKSMPLLHRISGFPQTFSSLKRINLSSTNYCTRKVYSTKQAFAEWPYIHSKKHNMAPQLDSYFKQVDSLADTFIERLRKAVAIPSVSADDDKRPEVVRVRTFQCNSS